MPVYIWFTMAAMGGLMTLTEAIQSALELVAQDDIDGALRAFDRIEASVPGDATVLRLRAQTYLKVGQYAEAARILFGLVRADPKVDPIFDLVWALVHARAYVDIVGVCAEYKHVIAGDKRFLAALGMAQTALGRYQDALATLSQAREVLPRDFYVRHNLSIALLHLGRHEEAVEVFSELLPDWDGSAPDGVTLERLDAISVGYDDNELHNYFSDRLLRLYQGHFPARRMRRVLEMGTGTGLLASKLPASTTSVTGIERSPGMLAQARARKVYDTLIEGEMPGGLASIEGPFETILSSCVLYYFADLEPFFREASRLTEPGGVFVFSVDPLCDPREVAATVPGEYAHSRSYLRRLATEAGFREVAMEIDRHRGPPGFWCAFKRG
ncbi:tetratricopeptide repeat protein [Paramagnetospirillum magneticum]|uniref:tetratricopeptide repeat protein n=1 Tax=Paramagnetospirillum magneticum TaxID=84159 RepID=UPI0011D09D45|nr:tetratricopeptide repeat protein [Paramagnetospirillum magneticum]